MCDPVNWHSASKIFPLLVEEDLKGLGLDIRRFGLQQSVVLYEGKILDGRNRALACRMFGIPLSFRTWLPKGDETPENWSISQNLYRRSLTSSQEVLALHSVNQEPSKKLKARHLLAALLGNDDEDLVFQIVSSLRDRKISVAVATKVLRGEKEQPLVRDELLARLLKIAPAEGDGIEHKLMQLLEECSLSKDVRNEAELKSIIFWLNEIASVFSNYSKRISKRLD